MEAALFVVALVAVVVFVAGIARKLGTSAPLMLTVVGIGLGYLPGVPIIEVEQEVVLLGLLPPLLYAAAIRTSLIDLRANIRSISLLSVGLVVFTTLGIGLLVWWLLDIPLALAIAFGGVIAPPDAVAATAVAKRIGLPRQMVTILEGESLFNDATALVIVRMGVLALGSAVTVWEVGLQFLWSAAGGILIGVAAYWVIRWVRGRIKETVSDTALSFISPWVAYLPAEELKCSGVLAVVIAGVLLGHRAATFQSASSRMAERINWSTVQFLLENGVFLLIGLQAHGIIEHVGEFGAARLLWVSAAVLLATILLRPVWMFATLPLWRASVPPRAAARAAGVVSWAGMRGVVTLAAVLSIPSDAPQHGVLVLLALVVVTGTLLLQGYTLPWVARTLGVQGDDPREEALQTANVIERTVDAGTARLRDLATDDVPEAVVHALKGMGERRRHAAWERLGSTSDVESPSDAYRRLRLEMIAAEREKLLKIRDTGLVSSEVLDEVMTGTDLEESMLATLGHHRAPVGEGALKTPERNRGDCEHLREADALRPLPVTPEGCAECLATGQGWVNLRICLACGHVGCCDSSPGKHAAARFEQTGHPVMRSFEPGEEWRWCFPDKLLG